LPLLPRLVRLEKKLNLTCKEKRALDYVVLSAVSENISEASEIPFLSRRRHFSKFNRRQSFFSLLKTYSEMSITEAIAFLRSTRVHVSQGVFTSDKNNPAFNEYVDVPHETIAALTGAKITTTERLKIDKTKLAEVLDEEEMYNDFYSLTTQGGSSRREEDNNNINNNINNNKEIETKVEIHHTQKEVKNEQKEEDDDDVKRTSGQLEKYLAHDSRDIFEFIRVEQLQELNKKKKNQNY